MAGDDFCLVTLLEASSLFGLFPDCTAPAPLLPPRVFSSVHPFSVSSVSVHRLAFTSPPGDPHPAPKILCAEVLLVCNSSLPPTLCSHCIFLGCLLDVTS